MKYIVEIDLEHFDAWAGGKDTLNTLIEKDNCDEVESLIEEVFMEDTPTETEINDFLWFERDFIAEHLGYDDWDDYEYGNHDDEDEEEHDDDSEEN